MKKYSVIIVLLVFNITLIYSQYTSPESVVYDSVFNRWLVTNSGGIIKQRNNATGVVTDFAPSGSGTHGIRIYNGVAYACGPSSTIRGFSLATGTQVFSVQITGASFLNGMGIDQSTGIAYISDFGAQRIYKLNLNTQAWWIYVPAVGRTPNGVYFDGPRNRLLVCCWGASPNVIKAVNLSDSTVTNVANLSYGNCDGIYLDKYDNVYVSSWSPVRILRFDIGFTLPVTEVISSGLSNPADIFINKTGDTLGVPNSGNSTVTFHNIGNIAGVQQINSNIPEKFSLQQNYPNPFNPVTKISFDISESSSNVKLAVFNTLGQQVSILVNEALTAGSYEVSLDAGNLSSGVYYYRLESGSFVDMKKMILLK